jgi:hypothetical protein
MIVSNSTIGPSLLPYLNGPPVGISIQLILPEQHTPIGGNAEDESGPFSVLRNGRVIVDGCQRLLDVTFVTQSDFYPGIHSELRPPTNLDVESTWQQTWAQINKLDHQTGPIVLPCQIDDNGVLIPFRSLFYCSHKDSYCHPLCPICGHPLVLCCNDDALESAGLPAYSKSLHRYLYCADCYQKASDEVYFYTRDLKGPSSARVKDSRALIQAFSRLSAESDLSDQLPCSGCEESVNCYGPDMSVLNRMQPLQFYPFHMLMHHASMFNAPEFLALVSGARSRQLLSVKGSGFLFEQDDRLFIEILFLKLTFLYELIVLISRDVFTPVSRMSLAGIGVDMKTTGAHLPCFWNFSLRLINPIGMPAPHPPGSELPHALIHDFLGHAWFYALLVNGTQQMVQLNTVIDEYLLKESNPEMNAKELFRHHVFDPGHIFWQPRSIEPASEWRTFWIEALEMGMTLLCAGSGRGSGFFLDSFINRLKALKSRVQQCLFNTPAVGAESTSETAGDANARITAILSNILEQWPQTGGLPKGESTLNSQKSPSGRSPDGDLPQTVLISSLDRKLAPPDGLSFADAVDADPSNKRVEDDEDELKETVIFQLKKK